MSKSTVFTAQETDDGDLEILVESAYTASLYKHLKSKKVNCTQPKAAVHYTNRCFIDETGKLSLEGEPAVDEIVAVGTLEDLEKWLDGWELQFV
jgi:hypothetical protein